MGTDWHPHIEELREDGRWHFLKRVRYDDPDPTLVEFKSRHYVLFGIIAGVRVREFPPLFECRGIPKDSSELLRKSIERLDLYSHTWFTIQELIDTDWNAEAGIEAVQLDPTTYPDWLAGGRRGIPNSLVEHQDYRVSEEEMVLLLASGYKTRRTGRTRPGAVKRLKPIPYVEAPSRVSYRDLVPYFVDDVIPALSKLGDPSKIRIVAGFDS